MKAVDAKILHFEPFLDALGLRSDVISSIQILSLWPQMGHSALLVGTFYSSQLPLTARARSQSGALEAVSPANNCAESVRKFDVGHLG